MTFSTRFQWEEKHENHLLFYIPSCNTNSEHTVTNNSSDPVEPHVGALPFLYSANEQSTSALFTQFLSLKPRYMFDMNIADNKPWHSSSLLLFLFFLFNIKMQTQIVELYSGFIPRSTLFGFFLSYFYFLSNARNSSCIFLFCFVLFLSDFWKLLPLYLFFHFKIGEWWYLIQWEGPCLNFICYLHVADICMELFCLRGWNLFCVKEFVPEHMCERCVSTYVLWIFSLAVFWRIWISEDYWLEFLFVCLLLFYFQLMLETVRWAL